MTWLVFLGKSQVKSNKSKNDLTWLPHLWCGVVNITIYGKKTQVLDKLAMEDFIWDTCVDELLVYEKVILTDSGIEVWKLYLLQNGPVKGIRQ